MMDKLKKGLIGSILISVILAVTLTYVWALTPTTTFYVSPGIFPGAPSYTIWNDQNVYYAKDENGQIDYSSSNASYVISSCIGALGHVGFIKCIGTFAVSTSILINPFFHNSLSFQFDSIIFTSDQDGFVIGNTTQNYDYFGKLTGNSINVPASYTHAAIKLVNLERGYVEVSSIWPSSGQGAAGSAGIELLGIGNGKGCAMNFVRIREIGALWIGIYLHASGVNAYSNANVFYDTYIEYPQKYGVYFNNSGLNTSGEDFYNILFDALYGANHTTAFYCQDTDNNFWGCRTVDWYTINGTDIYAGNGAMVTFYGGQMSHKVFVKDGTGQIILRNVYGAKTENIGTHAIGAGANTSCVFAHGLAGTPDFVSCSFADTGYASWKWSATSTQITVTIQTSVSTTVYWYAIYEP